MTDLELAQSLRIKELEDQLQYATEYAAGYAKQRDASEQTIQQLRAVADKLAEALNAALETLPTLYHLAEWYPQCQAALAQYAEMKSDKLASSESKEKA